MKNSKKLLISLTVMSIILLFGCNNTPKEFHEGLAAVEKDGKWGYVDTLENVVIPYQYDSVGHFEGGVAVVALNKKIGTIDKTGNVVIAVKYDSIGSFADNMAIVGDNGKYGFVDITGKEVIPLLYENVEPFVDGLATVVQNSDTSKIDKNGEKPKPQEYVAEVSFEKSKKIVVTIRLSADLKQATELYLSAKELYLTPKKGNDNGGKSIFKFSEKTTTRTNIKIENMNGYNAPATDASGNYIIDNIVFFGGFETSSPIDISDNKISLNDAPFICDLTVIQACIYGNIKIRLQGCETKSVYVVLKNTTTPQEISEEILQNLM
ncbi:MAG: WG repeat-containing protein [Candidatus Symbiothrix sp.]|nr:WG repeat-containing protein [Candidatus Symbiothrix sp.]